MQAAERAADAAGLTYNQMMENAGKKVAEAIEANYVIAGSKILILVGPGNNGGDGLVVARHLARGGAAVTAYVWKRNVEDDANWRLLDNAAVERLFWEEDTNRNRLTHLLEETAVIVDALLGTGVSRPIEGSLAEFLEQVQTAITARRTSQPGSLIEATRPEPPGEPEPAIVALDVPSGLNSDTGAVDPYTLAADLTVTLAAAKQGHFMPPAPEVVGELMIGDIGITVDHYPNEKIPELVVGSKIRALLPHRPPTAHKGTFGTALLVAGCANYTGAAMLAGQAAIRIGTGLVTMGVPRGIFPIVASRLLEATYLPLPDSGGQLVAESAQHLLENMKRANALLIGPGLGNSETTADFLISVLKEKEKLPALVLDADALNILAGHPDWWNSVPSSSILTPHPGEMARLTGATTTDIQRDRFKVAGDAANRWGQVVLLKGAHTIVASPDDRMMVLPFANPALAKAGSGDVLAGAIVGLLAQGMEPFEAAVAGAYVHGLAGELARDQLGPMPVVAGDLVSFIPMALGELLGF
jgi:NAD(P)H-hydrate epimerase